MIKVVVSTAVASAVYGFSLGWAHSPQLAVWNLAKLPMLLLGTAFVCVGAYYVTGRFLTSSLRFGVIRDLVLRMYGDLSVLLLSLSPATFFLACVLASQEEAQLGEYPMFLGFNMLLIAIGGTVAVVRQGRDLLRRCAVSTGRAAAVILCWISLSLVVGGQGSFYLRPMVGIPATRGQSRPFLLGARPSLRGAHNFFEVIWLFVDAPPLPPPPSRGR